MKPMLHTARWSDSVNRIAPPNWLRSWLVDRTSLTLKLSTDCQAFRVERLRQGRAYCLADEAEEVGLVRRMAVQEREVLLRCNEQAMVFAHTVVPLDASAADWPFFSSLGNRSLGTTLFGDPLVKRGHLQFAKLLSAHPLAQRAAQALGRQDWEGALYARRCLYARKSGVLLVTEVFLPEIANHPLSKIRLASSNYSSPQERQ